MSIRSYDLTNIYSVKRILKPFYIAYNISINTVNSALYIEPNLVKIKPI